MTLLELEALAKRATTYDRYETYRRAANPATILQIIALIRQLGDALKEAETAMVDHGTSYLNHEDEYSTGIGYVANAIQALKEFEHGND